MPDANYVPVMGLDKNTAPGGDTTVLAAQYSFAAAPTASALRICGMKTSASALLDVAYGYVAIFR